MDAHFHSQCGCMDKYWPVMSSRCVQADQADFEAFQDKVEEDQQAGLWFKRLHERKKPKNDKKV